MPVTAFTASSVQAGVAQASISPTSVSIDSNTGIVTPAMLALPVRISFTWTRPGSSSSPPTANSPTHDLSAARAFSSSAATSSAFCEMPAISA